MSSSIQVDYSHCIHNKNALSSVESRVFVDTISSDEANRAQAFVIQRGEGGGGLRI